MNEEQQAQFQAQLDRTKAEALDALLTAQNEAKHWQKQFNTLASELAKRLGHEGGQVNLDELLDEVSKLKKPKGRQASKKS